MPTYPTDLSDTMIQNTTPIVAMVVAMVICILVIPLAWRYAKFLGMIDEPGLRKVHLSAIPRVGGLGIMAGTLIAIFTLADLDAVVLSFILASLVILIFGIWDDTVQISPRTKFTGQIIAITIVIFYGDFWITQLPFVDIVPAWIGIPFTYFAIIGMTNAVNTSDGLDGMAGGESLLSLIVISFLAYIAGGLNASLIATSCIGGVLGFLRYNTHPAQIFMGDTGSQFLGFSLGFLAVLVTQKVHPALSPAITLLFLGLPIIDLVGVMFMRIKKGRSPFYADKTHIHHRLLDLGFDHYETVVIIYSIQALLMISAIFFRYQSDAFILVFYAIVVTIIYTLLDYAERTGWQASKEKKEKAPVFKTMTYFRQHKKAIIKLALRLLSLIIPSFFIFGSLTVDDVPRDFAIIAAVFFILMLLDLLFQKEHNALSLRGAVYITAIFTIYLVNSYESLPGWVNISYLIFIILATCIAIVVRYATDKKFQTSPLDYLIVFGVLVVAIFGGRYLQVQAVGILVVEAIILLYGCEVLLIRKDTRLSLLNFSAMATLGVIAFRGLVT